MILVLCRSGLFFDTLRSMAGGGDFLRFHEGNLSAFTVAVAESKPDLVVYEPSFFVDPAPYKLASPKTRFIVVGNPGDEDRTDEALRQGAVAALHKPLVPSETLSVLALAR